MYVHMFIHICTHTYKHTYIHTHIHSYIHSGLNYGGSESGAGGGREGEGVSAPDVTLVRRFLVIVVIKDLRLGRGVYSGNLEQSLPSSPHLSQLPVPVRYSFLPPSPLHPV
jgi:hypothetical protein